jgi:oligopeptide transport system ATP-binding protein
VTVQAQILELMKKMRSELGMAVILISHDLGVVSGFCDRAMVMYGGRVMETAKTGDLFYETKHPYTQALQKSIPALHAKGTELYTIRGTPPDLLRLWAGCPFAPRCDFAVDYCAKEEIDAKEVAPGHCSACLRVQKENLTL